MRKLRLEVIEGLFQNHIVSSKWQNCIQTQFCSVKTLATHHRHRGTHTSPGSSNP